jgi:hypothetical protein
MKHWNFTALRGVPVEITELKENCYQVSMQYPNELRSWQASSFEIIRAVSFASIMTTPHQGGGQIEILLADSELARLFPADKNAVGMAR